MEQIEQHPEFERYTLRLADGAALLIERNPTTPTHEGWCEANGYGLYPRTEFWGSTTPPPLSSVLPPLCTRLEALSLPPLSPPPPPSSPALTLTWALWATLGAGLALRSRAARDGWLIFAAATGLRLALAPTGIVNGGWAGWEKLVIATGALSSTPYGTGWPALMAPAYQLRGWAGVFEVNLLLSSLCAPLAWALARAWTGSPLAARWAGIFVAALPLSVQLAQSELMHIAVAALTLAALLGVTSSRRSGLAWGLLSLSLALHTRPDALPLALPSVAVAAWAGGWPRAALTLAVAGLAALPLLSLPPPTQLVSPSPAALLSGWISAWLPQIRLFVPRPGVWIGAHLGLTPFVIPLLSLAALLPTRATPRLPGSRALLGCALALTALPLLKSSPLLDALRLQLPSLLLWATLAGVGGARWVQHAATRAQKAALGLALLPSAWLLARGPLPRLVQSQEWDFLQDISHHLSASHEVFYDAHTHRMEKLADALSLQTGAAWTPMAPPSTGRPAPRLHGGSYVYLGLSCLYTACTPPGCITEALEERTLLPYHDLDIDVPTGAKIGLYRLRDCAAPALTTPSAATTDPPHPPPPPPGSSPAPDGSSTPPPAGAP